VEQLLKVFLELTFLVIQLLLELFWKWKLKPGVGSTLQIHAFSSSISHSKSLVLALPITRCKQIHTFWYW